MLERKFHWSCDLCGEVVMKEDYGLPDQWIILKAIALLNLTTRHACLKCRPLTDRKDWHKISLERYPNED